MIARLNEALSDRYRVERELGSGGMATVYLAEDLKHRRKVAIKVLRSELAAALGAERFLREIEIAAKLSHPHILPLLDSGSAGEPSAAPTFRRSDELLYYVMPYVEGESLGDKLTREKQLSLEDALQITKEVADALSYAHSQGVVHRDIKPENVLFQAGHAVVSDFGLARALTEAGGERLTETGIVVGTPAYMSPEQGAGSGEVDGRSDIYSLGCVLYEMLAGDAPYTASTLQALIAKKLNEPTPRISVVRETVPAEVEAALMKALAKAPADRFATAQEFVEALTTRSEEISPVPLVAGRGDKRRVWRWVGGLAAVVAAVVVGVVLLQGRRSGADSAGEEEIDRLVVAPFENRTGDSAAADWAFMAADFITRGIDRAGVVTVVPASRVRDLVLDEDASRRMTLGEIARRTGARYTVAGSYSMSAGRLRFDVELVDAESGELLRAMDPVSGPTDSLEAVVVTLTERVAAAATGLLNPNLGPEFVRWSSPPSLDAFRGLLTVQDLFCRTRYQAAINEAQPALQEAPDFAPLLVLVSISLGGLGRLREADSVLALVEPLLEQLTTEERLLKEWWYGNIHGDHETETRTVEELFRIQPGNYGYHAGVIARSANRFADALERLLAQDLDTPCYRRWYPWWQVTAQVYHMLGRYEDELAIAREGLERFPNRRPLIYSEAVALAGLGRLEAVDSILDVIEDLPPEARVGSTYNPGSQAALISLELEVLGLQQFAAATMDRALAWFASRPDSELPFERAKVYYWARRWPDADTMFAALITGEPDYIDYRGFRGVALAHLGRRDEAVEIDRWLEQLNDPFLRGAHTEWRAAIAAALGDREGAVRLLQQAYQQGMDLGFFHRRDPAWEPLHDYRPYQEFVRAR